MDSSQSASSAAANYNFNHWLKGTLVKLITQSVLRQMEQELDQGIFLGVKGTKEHVSHSCVSERTVCGIISGFASLQQMVDQLMASTLTLQQLYSQFFCHSLICAPHCTSLSCLTTFSRPSSSFLLRRHLAHSARLPFIVLLWLWNINARQMTSGACCTDWCFLPCCFLIILLPLLRPSCFIYNRLWAHIFPFCSFLFFLTISIFLFVHLFVEFMWVIEEYLCQKLPSEDWVLSYGAVKTISVVLVQFFNVSVK